MAVSCEGAGRSCMDGASRGLACGAEKLRKTRLRSIGPPLYLFSAFLSSTVYWFFCLGRLCRLIAVGHAVRHTKRKNYQKVKQTPLSVAQLPEPLSTVPPEGRR